MSGTMSRNLPKDDRGRSCNNAPRRRPRHAIPYRDTAPQTWMELGSSMPLGQPTRCILGGGRAQGTRAARPPGGLGKRQFRAELGSAPNCWELFQAERGSMTFWLAIVFGGVGLVSALFFLPWVVFNSKTSAKNGLCGQHWAPVLHLPRFFQASSRPLAPTQPWQDYTA